MTPDHPLPTLSKKLGFRPGHTVVLLQSPPEIVQELAAEIVQVRLVTTLEPEADIIHLFSDRKDDVAAQFPVLAREVPKHGAIWISWPKRSSNVQTDLTEDIVREIGLAAGMVDVKVCSVNDTWSGLKFVYRLQDRV